MTRTSFIRLFVLLASVVRVTAVGAQGNEALPNPLRLKDVLAYARDHRQELAAARARVRAAEQRAAIVSALDDPMVMPSIDHLPFMLHGVDASLMFEQRFSLSRVLSHRQRAAEAEAQRLRAQAQTVAQEVVLDVARAYLMLRERRETAQVLDKQAALARRLVLAANARYSAGTGHQPDVLRTEVELARVDGAIRAIRAEVVAAESMLRTALGLPADGSVPPLEATSPTTEPPHWAAVRDTALRRRPELDVGRAEISRAQADISVMESMYAPMGMVRTGPSHTMSDGWGWMLTGGLSIPLWRGKYEAGVREARAMADMAHADLAAMSRMVEGEAAIARQQVIATRQRVLALRDDVMPRARHAVEASVAAYAAGTLPLVSVVDAAQAHWSIEAELVSAEYELGLAWARLYRAQGQFEEGAGR